MRFGLANFLTAIFLMAVSASAASLTVRVTNIDGRGGLLHVALYTEALWPDDDATPVVDKIVPATAPETVVVMEKVTPGVYGVKTYQDVNKNDRFDQGLFGIPLERYGFSRDARPRLSAPSFSRAKFTVAPGENAISIRLQ